MARRSGVVKAGGELEGCVSDPPVRNTRPKQPTLVPDGERTMSLAEIQTEKRSDIGAEMRAVGRAARAAMRRLARATTADKNKALSAMAAAIREHAEVILAENALDVADARQATLAGSFLDRLTLDPARIEAMATGHRGDRGAARSRRHRARRLGPPERPPHRARADAARRHRHHLREPPQRHRRRRRAVSQGRQCCDPPRRLGLVPLLRRDPRLPGRRAQGRRACPRRRSSSCRPATAPRSG